MRARRIEETIFKGLMLASLVLVLIMLAGIIVITVYKGHQPLPSQCL